ncbi:MAG: exodeoxyribonuclease VII large subunit [Saprospiraceae bacterium]|jgi:exodeoxyribonuclease VII large subunit|nr:exodeoxyribonuclease VII large subunit [Saprospiraceae bacterium]
MSTLFELNEHIRRILALNFPQPLWVSAEVAQISESKGHFYLGLVQKGEDQDIVAQAQAVIWAGEYRQMLSRHGMALRGVLREGLELKIQVRPDFHERYGLKLQIIDVDPTFTLGQLDLQRRQTVQALRDLGLFDKNRALVLPLVLQRIAVISSETAAGLQDFHRQLLDNDFGYQFDLQLFNAAVQGRNSEQDVLAALTLIAKKAHLFDCVVIVRGGGSRLDLSSFDGLELCKAVANLPLPVVVGIGHDVDETVLDLVANRSLKTPTAVAAFILQHNLSFEGGLLETADQVRQLSLNFLKWRSLQLEQSISEARWAARQRLLSAQFHLDAVAQNLPLLTQQFLRNQYRALEQMDTYCAAIHPENVLRRGFSLTTKNGKAVTSPSDVLPSDTLETRVREGVIVSTVV